MEKQRKDTIVISAFPACGKSYTYKHFNGKPFEMLDSDSSLFSWVYDNNGNKTETRNPNFISDYINHIKENIGKVDVIFVSSHNDVRKALRENKIKYFIVHPSLDMKNEMLKRMKDRGSDDKFIHFQEEHYEQFINEIVDESKEFGSGIHFDGGYMVSSPLFEIQLHDGQYIDNTLIDGLLDNSMGNLSCMWWN